VEIQQKSINTQYDNILRQLDIINRRLDDFDHRMDDFNYRLRLLENSSINKQKRESVLKLNNNRINIYDDDLRF
jgi:hypothetical protein